MHLCSGFFLYSQEEPEKIQTNDSTVYVIRDIRYFITGKTKETALEREGNFKTGKYFSGQAELEEYIREKIRELNNIQALEADTSNIEFTLGEPEEDGAVPVYLEISVTDSTNLIILPVPKYDSNVGLTLSLRLREYNFLGNLPPPVKLDLLWESDDKNRTSIGFETELIIPFSAFGFNWTFWSLNEYKHYLTGEPFYDKNVLGIAMDVPVSFTTFTFGFEQGLIVHEDNTKKNTFESDEYHTLYLYSKFFVDWKIPTPLRAGEFGQIVYTPGFYEKINYLPGGDTGDYRRGFRTGFNQEIGFEQINWIGNYRQGLKVKLFNDNEYNHFRKEWINSAGAVAEGHIRISKLLGISGKLLYTKWINDYYEYAGDVIRGYKDNELDAKERLSLNLEFPIRLIRFVPSEWKENSKLRIFDFEQHWSPFIDFVMLDSPDGNYSFKPEDIITGIGLEVITFPLKWRSFYIRISAGWNLREWIRTSRPPSGKYREIYIGLGHYF